MNHSYYASCVTWPPHDVEADGGICDMVITAKIISRRTFLKHVNREDIAKIEKKLGYSQHPRQGLTMARDRHVFYSKSNLHGKRVVFLTHSAIEYVFRGQSNTEM